MMAGLIAHDRPKLHPRLKVATLAMQAPLLAYNHFVEALFVLNDCREGVHGGASVALTDGGAEARHLKGSAPAMRAKRDAIYRHAELLPLIT